MEKYIEDFFTRKEENPHKRVSLFLHVDKFGFTLTGRVKNSETNNYHLSSIAIDKSILFSDLINAKNDLLKLAEKEVIFYIIRQLILEKEKIIAHKETIILKEKEEIEKLKESINA